VAIDVETQITIARPRGEIAAYVSEPDNATEWYANIESADWQTARPLAVGSRFAAEAHPRAGRGGRLDLRVRGE